MAQENNTPGTGAANVLGALPPVLQQLFGGDGMGDDVSQIIAASRADRDKVQGTGIYQGNPFNNRTGSVPWNTLIIVAGAAFVLYLFFKK